MLNIAYQKFWEYSSRGPNGLDCGKSTEVVPERGQTRSCLVDAHATCTEKMYRNNTAKLFSMIQENAKENDCLSAAPKKNEVQVH